MYNDKGEAKFQTLSKMTHSKPWFMSFVIVWYNFCRVLYKTIYFYLFPYLIVPLSYYLYNNSKIEEGLEA